MVIEEIKKIDSSPKKIKEFGWVMAIFFSLLSGLLLWRGKPAWPIFLVLGGSFAALTLIVPVILIPLQKVWMTLAVIMGWFMSRLILGVLFYVAITPIALILRLTGKDLLDKKLDSGASSYWKQRPSSSRTHCERQF